MLAALIGDVGPRVSCTPYKNIKDYGAAVGDASQHHTAYMYCRRPACRWAKAIELAAPGGC